MSPLRINMLLHYYTSSSDYAAWISSVEPAHASSCAVREALQSFVDDGLLKSKFGDVPWAISKSIYETDSPIFSITDKGQAMVAHLRAVQIPVCKWVQPEAAQ
jgi:hypothetical protein